MLGEIKETCEILRELYKVVQAERLLIFTVIIQHFKVRMLGYLSTQTRGCEVQTHRMPTVDFSHVRGI